MTLFNVETCSYGLVDELVAEIPFKVALWSTNRVLPRKVFRMDDMRMLADMPNTSKVVRTIEDTLGRNVGGLWMNLYTDGNDYCPYHKDSYGVDVATFSAGDSRVFKTKSDKTNETTSITLSDGDVLFFDQSFNSGNKHSIPKTKRVTGKRVSVVAFLQ